MELPSNGSRPGPPAAASPKYGDLGGYWEYFDANLKEQTDEMINGLKDSLDNLLIFVVITPRYSESIRFTCIDLGGSLLRR